MGGGRGRLGQDGGALWARGALSGKQLRGGEGEVSAGPAAAPLGEKGAAASGGQRRARVGRALRRRRREKGGGWGAAVRGAGLGGGAPSFAFLRLSPHPMGPLAEYRRGSAPSAGGGVRLPPALRGCLGGGASAAPLARGVVCWSTKTSGFPLSRRTWEAAAPQFSLCEGALSLCWLFSQCSSFSLFFPIMSRLQGSK